MSAEWVDQPVPGNDGIPGKTLAAHREAMGWTVEQVADQLKLAVRQVIALEEGDYANLPGPAVVRGFVRAYAKILKIDAAPLVAQIPLDTPVVNDTSASIRRDRPASFSQARFPTNGKRARKLPLGLIAAAVLVAGAAAAAWQFGAIPSSLFDRSAPAAAAPGATGGVSASVLPAPVAGTPPSGAAAPAADAHPPVISNSVPLISVPPVAGAAGQAPAAQGGSPVGVAPAALPAAGAPAAPAAATAGAAAPDTLVLTVREDSWVEVRPPKGRAVFKGIVKGGTIETVKVTGPVSLIVGKPSAVSATLRGVAVELPAAPGGRIARVQLQ